MSTCCRSSIPKVHKKEEQFRFSVDALKAVKARIQENETKLGHRYESKSKDLEEKEEKEKLVEKNLDDLIEYLKKYCEYLPLRFVK